MENQAIEWKRQWDDEFLKWLCAFANTHGGVLEIGKDDEGNVVGLSNAQKLLEALPNKIRNALGIVATVDLIEESGKEFIRITTERYSNAIDYKGHYYIRSGSTTQELTGNALEEFILRSKGRAWDGVTIADAKFEELSAEAFEVFREKAIKSGRLSEGDLRMSDRELLDSLLLTEKGELKRAAILLFAKNPERWVPGAYVKIGYFNDDLQYYDEVHGAVMLMPDKVVDIIFSKYFKGMISYEGIQRVETFPVPRESLREAVLNSIMHKLYGAFNPIQIRIYDNKVIIYNAGKLPDDWTVSDMETKRVSKPYNPMIANAFFKSGMVETWGRGIERINESLRKGNRRDVVYEYSGSDITATFDTTSLKRPSNVPEKTLNQTQSKIISLISDNNTITTEELAVAVGIARRNIVRNISELKKAGLIERIGGDKGGHWKIVK